jgi:hypothetical protein
MRIRIAAVVVLISTAAVAQQVSKKSLDLQNAPSARAKSNVTITANVNNRSRTDATNGTVVFDNEYASCTVSFGAIHSQGGSASGSCDLDGYALTVKAVFNAANGTQWVGIAGNGQAFDTIDMNLNDPK